MNVFWSSGHKPPNPSRSFRHTLLLLAALSGASASAQGVATPGETVTEEEFYPATVVADVIAMDQPLTLNRLGAFVPQGQIFALRCDVEPKTGNELTYGNVKLREGKRPRPLVLRVNQGQTLEIHFQNLLSDPRANDNQPNTRTASVHVEGMQLVESILDDGSNVGANPSSLVEPGDSIVYRLYAEKEGTYLLYSTAANTGGDGDGGQLNTGLFGAVHVEPARASWFRSQITYEDFKLANNGTTAQGHPKVNYGAKYPSGHPRAGKPILNMLWHNTALGRFEIVHSDLTAIITGPRRGNFVKNDNTPWYPPNPVYPNRNRPFREFTIIYHDELGAVQAFPIFGQGPFEHTLHSVRDAFAINYGTGGIGAEILANRFDVGPMWDCIECKYEEFFLSAWTVADPAMIVDEPANTTIPGSTQLQTGPKAEVAMFPDDPSNVYHSYMGDNLKFRILHGGSHEHHIHHLHAHQWLRTPNSDNSAYLDSQAIGPGGSYTMEIAYASGNLNKTVGDSIFHCHFYPHFAQGMWAMWRVHDVFEWGSELDKEGRPIQGTRALPDGEIPRGTPIPGVVPIPRLVMPPMPRAKAEIVQIPGQPGGQVKVSPLSSGGAEIFGNPGWPFYIPGIAGHRPPHPPMDTIDDGGLPRHVVKSTLNEPPANQNLDHHVETRFDFTKELLRIKAAELPEGGTTLERIAMDFHATPNIASYTPEGLSQLFQTNGRPPAPGAPYADPCVDSADTERLYKAANFQMDVVFNKVGWHFPQQRILALWDDVEDTQNGLRDPEPLFFRANSGDCVVYELTTLVPNIYELDDFQVRTPTDILGQHIHLVKFDVTASDGAGNGFNYEDGSFSPDEVRERIEAINQAGGLISLGGTQEILEAEEHPFFGPGEKGEYLGAQTTVQRWYADPIVNNMGDDRTLRTVFTHDHFGPSTHQQVGLYAGLVVEPRGSTWRDPVTGTVMGTRFDGGPTSWKADILNPDIAGEDYREFLLEFGDFQLGYYEGGGEWAPFPDVTGGFAFVDPDNAINPPGREEPNPVLPFLLIRPEECPDGSDPPCPEAVSADDPGTMVVNYRNEPIPLRIRNPGNNQQSLGPAGDLSNVFRSDVARDDPRLDGDPFTPLMEAYENDQIQVRLLVGAHEEGHNVSINGIRWLYEPSEPNSGYKGSQMMGISEHFEFIPPPLSPLLPNFESADYLYKMGSAVDDLWNGIWGILRTYNLDSFQGESASQAPSLLPLPSNPEGRAPEVDGGSYASICPSGGNVVNFTVYAVSAAQAINGGKLKYHGNDLTDPTAIVFVRASEYNTFTGKITTNNIEPLILRANAGDCIRCTLINKLPQNPPDLDGYNTLPMLIDYFNANQVKPSNQVGLHPQLLDYPVVSGDGQNVGFNPVQTVGPNGSIQYEWYAGKIEVTSSGINYTPIEFGAIPLNSSDPIKHSNKGAVGALIVEPKNATWVEDYGTHASATVTLSNGKSFREFVVVLQNDLNLRYSDGSPVRNLADTDDPEDTGQHAVNYRTEPIWFRMGHPPETPFEITRDEDFTNAVSNQQVGGLDPITPVFTATAGDAVRFRIVHPAGHARNNVFNLHGHIWEEEPWVKNSEGMGDNPLSEWTGTWDGIGPSAARNIILKNGAGGKFQVPGDYLWRDFESFSFDQGTWGLLRVLPSTQEFTGEAGK